MKTIKLSLVENYVAHWSWWEATRELLQNAIDTEDFDVSFFESKIIITSNGGKLPVSALLMGKSSKQDDDSKIGKFGDGLKCGLLVLNRLGAKVSIENGKDLWEPVMIYDETFEERVLSIVIREDALENAPEYRVRTIIEGIPSSAMVQIKKNYAPARDLEIIVEDENYGKAYKKNNDHNCRLYVNGLFITEVKGKYKFDYDFPPATFTLDRDRNQVSEFEVRWNATRLLTQSDDILMLADLGVGAYDDLEHYDHQADQSYYSRGYEPETLEERAVDLFKEKNGYKAFPVNENWSQERKRLVTEMAIQNGLTPVTVKKAAYHMLKKEFAVPETVNEIVEFKALDYLEKFFAKYSRVLYSKPKKELENTIKMLKIAKGVSK